MSAPIAGVRSGLSVGPTRGPKRRLSAASRRRLASRRLGRLVIVALLAGLVAGVAFVQGLLAAPADFALPPAPRPALLYAADGQTQIGVIRPANRREPVAADQIPDVMREAMISAEDERFLDHSGVDVRAVVRAAYNDLSGGRLQGGSTITQQYVKNATQQGDDTISRKIREASLAVRLEQRLTKDEILTDYLNVLYLGNGSFGVQAASKYYFGVPIDDLALDVTTGLRDPTLEIARAAMLAGIAPAPSVWNPVHDPDVAKARQRYTLNRMVVGGFLTPQEASDALGVDIVPVRQLDPEPPSSAPEFTDKLKQKLQAEYGGPAIGGAGDTLTEDRLFKDGLRVTSTLDPTLQRTLQQALDETIPNADNPEGASVAIDWKTGDVKAMATRLRRPERVIPADPKADPPTAGRQVPAADGYVRNGTNLATDAYRSSGSTIKPFTLATALEQGHSLDETVFAPGTDSISCKGAPDGVYRYSNAGGEGSPSRQISLRDALARSVNTVYVPLALEVGTTNVRDLMVAAGARTRTPEAFNPDVCSFGLGTTAEVNPLSLANAFGTLMNGGVRQKPRYFTQVRQGGEGADPGVVRPGAGAMKPGTRAMPKEIADQVVDAMSKVATSGGTAPRAAQPFVVYGKTGTTNDSSNAWFVGCSIDPQTLCIATWMGYEYTANCDQVKGPCGGMLNVNGVPQVFGGTLPAQVYARSWQLYREAQAAAALPPPDAQSGEG